MKKIISVILVLVMCCALFTSCGKATMDDIKEDPSIVVATIGDKEIYAYEMIYLLRMGLTKEQALEELYSMKAVLIEAEKNGITLGDEDVKAVNDRIAQFTKEQGEEAFAQELEATMLTEKQFIDFNAMMNVLQRFQEKMNELGILPEYTDEDMASYYDENILKAKHILILTQDESGNALEGEAKDKKKEEAQAILDQIKAGADFDSLVASKSEDPGSKSVPDGYLFLNTANFEETSSELALYQQYSQQGSPVGVMVKEFTEGTAAIKVNEVSELIETSYGYHIIKRLDPRANAEDFNNCKEVIKAVKTQIDYSAKLEEWVNAQEKKEIKKYIDALDVEPYQPPQQQMPQEMPAEGEEAPVEGEVPAEGEEAPAEGEAEVKTEE